MVIGTRPETTEATARECMELSVRYVWMHRTFELGSVSATATCAVISVRSGRNSFRGGPSSRIVTGSPSISGSVGGVGRDLPVGHRVRRDGSHQVQPSARAMASAARLGLELAAYLLLAATMIEFFDPATIADRMHTAEKLGQESRSIQHEAGATVNAMTSIETTQEARSHVHEEG